MTVRELARYFAWLGTTGFGGPVALVGQMRRDLVESRGWFTADEYARGLAVSQIAPGPLAAQLAMYLGWLRGGTAGAAICGATFVLPSFALVLAFSAIYVRVGEVAWLQHAFTGVGAAIVLILARAVARLVRGLPRHDSGVLVIAAANAAAVLVLQRESIVLLLLSALVFAVPRFRTAVPALFALPAAAAVAAPSVLQVLMFFTISGMVVFGSGLAVMPFVYTELVQHRAWLTERQFLDSVAIAMVTPGPVIVLVVFIGYIVAGPAGGIVAALGVLAPAYVTVVAVAPRVERLMQRAPVRRFVAGLTAGATGALVGAALLIGWRTASDLRVAALAGVLGVVVWLRPRLPEPLLIVAAGVIGVAIGARL